tara:strand:- start:2207 stop:2404 length:198 start_codon:yes stop_codon:yes gene_type:complete
MIKITFQNGYCIVETVKNGKQVLEEWDMDVAMEKIGILKLMTATTLKRITQITIRNKDATDRTKE